MKRKGAIAVYIEPWHADIYDVLDIRKNSGKEELRARDLFTAMWICDLFMERVDANEKWSLFSPDETPMLTETYGDEFRKWYLQYEAEGKAMKVVDARDVWNKILDSQIETGTPYMLYKDHINKKSNQANIGIIRSSNLCAEVVEHTSEKEVAVCNLASIPVNKFVQIPSGKAGKDKSKRTFDFDALWEVAHQAIINLNRIIDINFYPIPEAEYSNKKNRPVGLGIQGLADAFVMLGLDFDSPEAQTLNVKIFETMHHASLTASYELAKKDGPYETYEGSPASKGLLQYNLWGMSDEELEDSHLNWKLLKAKIAKYGLRNSLLMNQMPTASCLTSDTKILLESGPASYQEILETQGIDWQTIENTVEQRWINFKEPIKVQTRNGIKEADKIFYNGHVPTIEIELEDGTIVRCSHNHKFLVFEDVENAYPRLLKWKRTDELSIVDVFVNLNGETKIIRINKGVDQPTWDIEVADGHEFVLANGVVTHNTAQILGNNESIEAFTSNLYKRTTLSGEFIVVNKHLVEDLTNIGLWSDEMRLKLIAGKGSIQGIDGIPVEIKSRYRTVWEYSQRVLLEMSAARGKFICQTQSMNLFIRDVNAAKLTSAHYHSWRLGCKTGMYYLRTNQAADAMAGLAVDLSKKEAPKDESMSAEEFKKMIADAKLAAENGDEDCLMCSS